MPLKWSHAITLEIGKGPNVPHVKQKNGPLSDFGLASDLWCCTFCTWLLCFSVFSHWEVAFTIIKRASILLGLGVLIVLYRQFNPSEVSYFPSCPLHSLTGLKCPGCGSQRAIHHLLNGEFVAAFRQNMLLIIALPYVGAGILADRIKKPSSEFLIWRKMIFGTRAIYAVLVIIIAFGVMRNIL